MTSMIAPVAPESEAILDSFYEVVRGQIREKPLLGTWENWIANVLGRHLDNFVTQHELGTLILENLFLLDRVANLQRRPDIAFVSRQRWLGLPAKSNAWEVVPDLAVEVNSPTNRADEVMAKIEEYFRAGVRLVWVVYCEQRKVYIYTSPRQVAIFGASRRAGWRRSDSRFSAASGEIVRRRRDRCDAIAVQIAVTAVARGESD